MEPHTSDSNSHSTKSGRKKESTTDLPPPYPNVDLPEFARKALKTMTKSMIHLGWVNLSSMAYLLDANIRISFETGIHRNPHKEDSINIKKKMVDVLLSLVKGRIKGYDWNRVRGLEFQKLWHERKDLLESINSYKCLNCTRLNQHFEAMHKRQHLQEQLEQLKETISDQNLLLVPDYNLRIGVLQQLKYIDAEHTVQLKGQVACEINSADELVLTELVLNNVLSQYKPEETVALLSCFVCKEKDVHQKKWRNGSCQNAFVRDNSSLLM